MIRTLDLLIATVGLVATAPLLLLLLFIGWWDTGAPLFCQTRIGRRGHTFTLWKLRTMRPDTPQVATHLAPPSAVTRWGRFLRRTKLDELPQLINVIKGDMSLVGPRPCLPTQIELIAARARLGVLEARPGLTGLAQLSGIDMSTPERLAEVEAQMLEHLTLRSYLSYLLLTLMGKGARDALPPHKADRHPQNKTI
ncbi:sugar transferase [Hydrogenophilus thiooxidans]|uniref:sugar transferase n=1 Tax=Hydrogenophilus thiooxidans TaxID=2820326 RepID=UPI003211BC48